MTSITQSPLIRAAYAFSLIVLIFLNEAERGLFQKFAYCAPSDTWMLGEYLYYGLESSHISNTLPLSSMATALMQHHMRSFAQAGANMSLLAVSFLLTFQLGRLLFSAPVGMLAAAAASLLNLVHANGEIEDRLFATALLLTANLLAWTARRPDTQRNILLGTAIGLSLLIRSPLVLFPPLLMAWSWLRREKISAYVLLVPAAVLLPWIAMNFSVHDRFIPLSDKRVEMNLAAGALGWVEAVEGHGLLEHSGTKDATFLWFARESLAHPLRSLSAIAGRFVFFFSLHPFLLLLGGLAFWRCRGRKDHQQVALLLVYFILTHCLVAVSRSYFTHIWLVVTVFALGALALPLRNAGHRPMTEVPMAPAWVGLIILGTLGAMTLIQVSVYPVRRMYPLAGLDRALRAGADNPWLHTERGHIHMRAQDPYSAAADFAQALRQAPRASTMLDYAWALLGADGPAQGLVDGIPTADLEAEDLQLVLLLKSIRMLERRRIPEARSLFDSALKAGLRGCTVPDSLDPAAKSTMRKVCGTGLVHRIRIVLDPFASARRLELMRYFMGWALDAPEGTSTMRLKAAADAFNAHEEESALSYLAGLDWRAEEPQVRREAALLLARLNRPESVWLILKDLPEPTRSDPELLLTAASAAVAQGEAPAAERFLLRAASLRPAPALVFHAAGLFNKEISVLRFYGRHFPGHPVLQLELARQALRLRKRDLALEALARIRRRPLSTEHALRAAQIYLDAAIPDEALSLSAAVLARAPENIDALILQASAAQVSGDARTFSESIAHALWADPPPSQRLQLAHLLQQGREFAAALKTLAPLLESSDPRVAARAWHESGVILFLLDRPAQAAKNFRQALSLDPGLEVARTSLDAISASPTRR